MQEELIQEFKNGNKRAGDDFYNANKGLIYLAIRKFKLMSMELEETEALVNQAFAKAMTNYNSSNGSFSTYFMKFARGYILRHCRDWGNLIRSNRKDFAQNKVTKYCESFDTVIYTSEGQDICIKDKLGMVDDQTESIVIEAINKINLRDRQAFKLYYLDNYLQTEIGEMLGTTQMTVSRSITKVKASLRIFLKEVG